MKIFQLKKRHILLKDNALHHFNDATYRMYCMLKKEKNKAKGRRILSNILGLDTFRKKYIDSQRIEQSIILPILQKIELNIYKYKFKGYKLNRHI